LIGDFLGKLGIYHLTGLGGPYRLRVTGLGDPIGSELQAWGTL